MSDLTIVSAPTTNQDPDPSIASDRSTPSLPLASAATEDELLFETLRAILLKDTQQAVALHEAQLAQLRQNLEELKYQVEDEATLIETINPILGDAIGLKIQNSRQEMVQAIKPIIGPLVSSAVSESQDEMIQALHPIVGQLVSGAVRGSKQEMTQALTPIVGQLITSAVRESKGEMIQALYPIIGQLVVRAVSEAMRDLVRNIDARMRQSLSPRGFLQSFLARLRGVSDAEMILRNAAPFSIEEIFVIHSESGLLIEHKSLQEEVHDHSDIISGMLTAIRSFTEDAFGAGQDINSDADLDEIQYGDASILIEAARYSYVAVVISGIEPRGFRDHMRKAIYAFDLANTNVIQNFGGDVRQVVNIDTLMSTLSQKPDPSRNES